MRTAISVWRDHQNILCGLEILRLMREQIENRQEVDRGDIQAVLDFMREVAHPCLDNAENLLRPALAKLESAEQSQFVNATLSYHEQVRLLFGEMTRAADPCAADQFITV